MIATVFGHQVPLNLVRSDTGSTRSEAVYSAAVGDATLRVTSRTEHLKYDVFQYYGAVLTRGDQQQVRSSEHCAALQDAVDRVFAAAAAAFWPAPVFEAPVLLEDSVPTGLVASSHQEMNAPALIFMGADLQDDDLEF